jgi:hypothetical protein
MPGAGPTQEQKTTGTTTNQPLAQTLPLINSWTSSFGSQFGGAPLMGGSGNNTLAGSGGNDGLLGGGYSAPAGKRLPPGTGANVGGFNFGLNPTETTAINAMANNADSYSQYAPDIGLLAGDLFKGGTDRTGMVTNALDTYRAGMSPYASMSTNPFDDANFNKALGYVTSDALDKVKSSMGGAGIPAASFGNFGDRVGAGVTEASMPFVMQRQNELERQKLGGIQGMLGADTAGAGLLSGLDQTALGNRMQGVGVGQQALAANDAGAMRALQIEAQRRGIPIQNAAQLASLIIPMAQTGGTSNSNSTTTQQTQVSPMQSLLGAGMLGAGFLTGNPMMAMGGGSGLLAGMTPGSPAANMFGSGVNTGVMGGGYLGPGGQIYAGPGWYGA